MNLDKIITMVGTVVVGNLIANTYMNVADRAVNKVYKWKDQRNAKNDEAILVTNHETNEKYYI